MNKVLALLEVALPLYWNTSTRHYLLHIADSITKMGHLWAFSMLGVERLHVLIKHLSKGRKNIMKSFPKNYNLFSTSQICWRHDPEHQWSNKGDGSSLHSKQAVPSQNQTVCALGMQTKRTASPGINQMLQDSWEVLCPEFRAFRAKYRDYLEGTKICCCVIYTRNYVSVCRSYFFSM